MIVALTHFGSDEFLPLLKFWFTQYVKSGCLLDVVIFADHKVTLPAEFVPFTPTKRERFTFVRADPIPEVVRPGRAFDIKGSLVLTALETVPNERIYLVDSDAFFVKDPIQALCKMDGAFHMGDDPMVRFIKGIDTQIKEKNAGVLFFGTTNPEHRKRIRQRFTENFKDLQKANDNALLEQIAWTKTWHDLKASGLSKELPRPLNWSYIWGRNDPGAYVLHEHGPQKWARIPGTDPKSKTYHSCYAP